MNQIYYLNSKKNVANGTGMKSSRDVLKCCEENCKQKREADAFVIDYYHEESVSENADFQL